MRRATIVTGAERNTGAKNPDKAIVAVLVPLMLVLFISTLDQTIVAAALGRIGVALGEAGNAPWIATSYLLTSAISTLLFGKLGDIVGRKPVFLASVAIFVFGSGLCALAPGMTWLIGFRALQGVGGGGLNSLVMAIVGDLVPARERARYQAILGLVPAIAIILGPVVGGLIADHWGWPWIFVINVPVGLLSLAIIARRLQIPIRSRMHRTASASTFSMFRNGLYVGSVALFFLSTAALFVGMLFVPLMLQDTFGLTASTSGASIVPLLLGLIAATTISGVVISRTGKYKAFLVAGAALSMIGFVALAQIRLTTSLSLIFLALGLIGFGLGFLIQVVVLAGQNAVEHQHLGMATGTLNFFKTIGGATGAATFGAVLKIALTRARSPQGTLHAYVSVFAETAAMMGLALVLTLLMREKPLSAEMIEIAEGKVDVPEY